MSFLFTQQIEATQNEITQLQTRLELYSKTDDYLTQSEELQRQVTNYGFTEQDLQSVRSGLQDTWNIVPRLRDSNSYDSTSELEDANSCIVELQNKIKSLEASLEIALTQRDRNTKKYTELLKQSINNSPEVEFLDTFDDFTHDEISVEEETEDKEFGSESFGEYFEKNSKKLRAEKPLEVRVKEFIKMFREQDQWECYQRSAQGSPKFFQEVFMSRSKKKNKIRELAPKRLVEYIERTGDYSDKDWVGATLWGEVELLRSKRNLVSDYQQDAKKLASDLCEPGALISETKAQHMIRAFFGRNGDRLDEAAKALLAELNPETTTHEPDVASEFFNLVSLEYENYRSPSIAVA